ncbi:MAG TPA: septum formation family protein [Micromonosporaceae bacterium]|nr:septum formation family protein [Micromonosporaceae bacterium]
MRRVRLATAAVAGALVAAVLAGCTLPAGVDGKIGDDWPAPPDAKAWVPEAGRCYAEGFVAAPTFQDAKAVPCTDQHLVESVYVGSFAEDRQTQPPDGSPEIRGAYGECLTRTTEFLGDDWRAGRLWLGLAMPSSAAWAAGARWYRCDLWEVKGKDDPEDVARSTSLKDGLRGSTPLRYGCYVATVKNDKVQGMSPIECTKPHNAEFAGVFVAPDVTYPKTDKERDDLAFNGCQAIAAKFAAIPNDGKFFSRTGLIVTPYSEQEWNQGNRGIRCHLWLGRNVTRSMKDAGPKVLPTG